MKSWFKKTGLLLLVVFLLLQLYQPARNINNKQDLNKDFVSYYKAPENIKQMLVTACYDCHSNNTNYRWYDLIQPARILVENHIREAKAEINFSEWTDYSSRKQNSKLEMIIENIENGEMPLKSYTMIHQSAKLNDEQKQTLINWLNEVGSNK